MLQQCISSESNLFAYTGQRDTIVVRDFINENYLKVISSPNFTAEGYKIETVNKILAAKQSKKVSVPSDEQGFLAWLKAKRI